MNKKLYNAPEVREINYRISEVVMLGASDGSGNPLIEDGGSTSDNPGIEPDANKRNAEWGNLW